ncbi:MAG TPA: alpha-2-macroglobulin family protein, partial [Candidatus Ozemobacteraceae bacterium]|nr:alpha-2-macroglobulin family protein [Candidatus Ozemobacteraceae bacterium]
VQALPYLMEFPHECSEQTFNRIYANSLARRIAMADPKIKKVFETWKAMEAQGGTALKSNLEKNESLKNALLIETPWVLDAQDETARKHRVGLLFDSNRVDSELQRGLNRLRQMQLSDGAFPWFPGGRPSSFITLYITTGFGRLRHLGVDIEMDLALKAVGHLDSWIRDVYNHLKRLDLLSQVNIGYETALYLYGRSFFLKERPIPSASKEAVDYFLGQAEKYWLKVGSRMSQAHVALGLQRFGRKEVPAKIVASLKERSVNDEELGLFWRDTEESWWWYRAPIETQALMIEVFDEIANDAQAVEDAKVWLIKQKQTQDWKTSKATADAIYGLLLKGVDLLASDKLVRAKLGGTDIQPPANVEAGTGYYEVKYAPAEIKP